MRNYSRKGVLTAEWHCGGRNPDQEEDVEADFQSDGEPSDVGVGQCK